MAKLYQRGPDGYPIGSDAIMRKAYGKIPDAELFQHIWGWRKPAVIHGWEWSDTFGSWSALVTFGDPDWHGYTFPKPGGIAGEIATILERG